MMEGDHTQTAPARGKHGLPRALIPSAAGSSLRPSDIRRYLPPHTPAVAEAMADITRLGRMASSVLPSRNISRLSLFQLLSGDRHIRG